MITETSCDLNTWHYPFDHHTCTIELVENKDGVRVEPEFKEFIMLWYSPDGSWDVTDVNISGEDSNVIVSIALTRKPIFVLISLVLPLLTIAFLSPLVFLLPNNSGERVGFSVTVLLAISVFMTIVSDHLPNKSSPVPLLSMMLLVSYSLTALVVIVVVINGKIHDLPDRAVVPRVLLWLVAATRCLCCCFRRPNTAVCDLEGNGDSEQAELKNGKENQNNEERKTKRRESVTWQDVSWALDMIFMVVIFLAKFILLAAFLAVCLENKGHKLDE